MNKGTIVAIRGSIVDVYFPDKIPKINNQLKIENIKNKTVILKVVMLLIDNIFRYIQDRTFLVSI